MRANAAGVAAKTSVVFSLLANEEIVTALAPLDPRPSWIIADLRVAIEKLHEIVDGSSLKDVPGMTRRVIAPCRSDPEGIHVRGHLLHIATRLTVTRYPAPVLLAHVPGPEPGVDNGNETTGSVLSVLLEPSSELPQVVFKPLVLRAGMHSILFETCPQPARLSGSSRHRLPQWVFDKCRDGYRLFNDIIINQTNLHE